MFVVDYEYADKIIDPAGSKSHLMELFLVVLSTKT